MYENVTQREFVRDEGEEDRKAISAKKKVIFLGGKKHWLSLCQQLR